MNDELTIDRTKEFPKSAIAALKKELLERRQNKFDECSLVINLAGFDGFRAYGDEKEAKKKVEEILQ